MLQKFKTTMILYFWTSKALLLLLCCIVSVSIPMNASVLHCIWFPWHYSRKANALLSTSDQYKTTSTVNAHTVHRIDLSCWRVHFSTLYMAVHCSWLGMYHVQCTVYSDQCNVLYNVQCTVYSAMYCTMYAALHCSLPGWLGMYPGAAGFHH